MNYSSKKFNKPKIPAINVKQKNKLQFYFTSDQSQLFYVYAPIGYGKTIQTFLALKKMRCTSAWFSTDQYDVNSKNFCKGVIFSLAASMKINKFMMERVNTSSFADSPLEILTDLLTSASVENIPDAIVFDDFHLCQNSETAKIVIRLQKLLPSNKLLIILSRNKPSIEFSEQILKKNVHTIGVEDLRFIEDEIERLFMFHNIELSKGVFEEIRKQTGGCIMYILTILEAYKNNGENYVGSTFADYIKVECFETFNEETKDFLMRSSILETINIDYCKKVLNFGNCENILRYIADTTGFITELNDNEYKYNDIVREYFKRELLRRPEISLKDLYSRSAYWFCSEKSEEKAFTALRLAFESGDLPLINDIVMQIAESHEIGVIDYAACVTPYLNQIRENTLSRTNQIFPSVCTRCAWICFLEGRLSEMHIWLKEIEKFCIDFKSFQNSGEIITAVLICSINPRLSSKETPGFFEAMQKRIAESTDLLFLSPQQNQQKFFDTITFNLPFFHRAQRDYGDIANSAEEFLASSEKSLYLFLGVYYKSLHNLLAAGLYYEKNELEKALGFAQNIIDEFTEHNAEILFAANIILTEILFAKNLKDDAYARLEETRLIIEKKALYLKNNLRAYEIREMLYDGKKNAAKEWLANADIYTNKPLKFYQCFQNMITVKALIVMGDFNAAVILLKKVIEFSERYNRLIDKIEALCLMSICCRKKKKHEDAVLKLTEAVLLAQKTSVISPIILMGADIVFILRKIINKTDVSYLETDKLDKAFVNRLLLLALERGKIYKGMFSVSGKTSNIKLSPKQTLVLKLLAENRTYCEIGEIGKIKITTVREHTSRIYEKLEVSNSTDALLKARSMGLIDK